MSPAIWRVGWGEGEEEQRGEEWRGNIGEDREGQRLERIEVSRDMRSTDQKTLERSEEQSSTV